MQTFHNILSALDAINIVPGKNDKTALVEKHLNDPDFKRAVILMLNPFKRFYIKNFETTVISENHDIDVDHAWRVFDELSTRSLSGRDARLACGALVAAGFPAELMIRILNKDPKAGFGESTVNKACKGLLPDFIYMRCALPKDAKFNTWDWKRGVISQEKADGMYCAIEKSNGDISLSARSGKPFDPDSFPNIVRLGLDVLNDNTQTQGELLVIDIDGKIQPREIGNGILNKVSQGGKWPDGFGPVFRAWDQIPLSEVKAKVKYCVGYADRLTDLIKQLAKPNMELAVIDTKIVHSFEDAKAHYAEMLSAGKEGTILSEPNAPWIDSTSKFKIKFKLTAPCELRVTGWRPGKNKNASTFGALVCESEDGLLEVGVSGFTDTKRKEIFGDICNWIGSIVTVESNMIMAPSRDGKKWSLFLPRFVERRLDKDVADNLQQIKDQFDAAASSV